jgi:hypothetical protein
MKVELETVIDILRREIKPGSSLFSKDNSLSLEMELGMELGMIRGVSHCINLLIEVNDECSMDVGKYLSLTRSLPDDYPRERGINH